MKSFVGHGAPREWLSHRGTNFLSKLVKETCKLFGTYQKFSSAYHPQTNGVQERYHATLIQSLSMYVDSHQKDWDVFLPAVLFSYRACPATRSTGHSPFMLLYGREPTLPLDIHLTVPSEIPATICDHLALLISKLETVRHYAIKNLEEHSTQMKTQADKSVHITDFKIGDVVYVYTPHVKVHTSKKLAMLWSGPYILTEKLSDILFKLRRLSDNKLISVPVHVNRFKQATIFRERPLNEVLPDLPVSEEQFNPDMNEDDIPPISDNLLPPNLSKSNTTMQDQPAHTDSNTDTELFEVEKVLKGRYKNGKLEYLVKWQIYPSSANTWEPEHNLNEVLLKYLKENPVSITGKPVCTMGLLGTM